MHHTERDIPAGLIPCLTDERIHFLTNAHFLDDGTQLECNHLEFCTTCWDRYAAVKPPLSSVDLPGFHIVEEIGRGRSTVVYAAWRLSVPRKLVAVKFLWLTDEAQRLRFEREASIHQRLEARGIVKAYSLGSHGPFLFYEMELIRGQPLDVYLAMHATTLREKLVIFERICRCLAVAHRYGIAHRDLKPSNILVDATGQPHVLDFGLGIVQPEDRRTSKAQTRLGDILGTVKY
ncbi:MAG: protein kinase, partial [Planctomycetota bacterium]